MTELYEALRMPKTAVEIADYHEFTRLRGIQANKSLSPSETKRFSRVRTRLLKAHIIRPVTQERLRKVAMEKYVGLPWYRRWRLKAKFRWMIFKEWLKTIQ